MKTIVAVAASVLMGVSLFAADAGNPRKAPELTFTLPDKGTQQLSQYRGKVVALAFMMTTCPHCQAKSKELTKLQEEFGAKGLQVLGVAVNQNADLLVENFVKDYKVGFPVGWVAPDQMISFMAFDAKDRWVVPQLALVDRKGMIRYQTTATETPEWDKLMASDALRAHIEELLNLGGNSAATSSTAHKKALAGLDVPAR
jgi:peroxiredoxin